jgi:hypothetical protein
MEMKINRHNTGTASRHNTGTARDKLIWINMEMEIN